MLEITLTSHHGHMATRVGQSILEVIKLVLSVCRKPKKVEPWLLLSFAMVISIT